MISGTIQGHPERLEEGMPSRIWVALGLIVAFTIFLIIKMVVAAGVVNTTIFVGLLLLFSWGGHWYVTKRSKDK